MMKYYEALDTIMKQDIGKRGLLPALPSSPLRETAASLAHAKRAVLLTGFPVRLDDGTVRGETDGPSGTANLAAALTGIGCGVSVITDWVSYPLLEAALRFRAPKAVLICLPRRNTESFIRTPARFQAHPGAVPQISPSIPLWNRAFRRKTGRPISEPVMMASGECGRTGSRSVWTEAGIYLPGRKMIWKM